MSDGPIKALYGRGLSDSSELLDRARLCASLTLPEVLPPDDQDKNARLPDNHNSIGAMGTTNMAARFMLSLFPPDDTFFRFLPSKDLRFNPRINQDPALQQDLQQAYETLHIAAMMVTAVLESSSLAIRDRGGFSTFRNSMQMAIIQLIITGDVLLEMNNDFALRVWRRDQYVTKRDHSANVLWHIVCEKKDPLNLTDEQLAKAKLNRSELEAEENYDERLKDLYTRVAWDHSEKVWKIEQELEGFTIAESTEKVSPFFSVPFRMVPGEDYGRGFIEQYLGDLRTHDALRERMVDWAGMASKFLWGVEQTSLIRDDDLAKDSGSIVRGVKIRDGKWADVGLLQVEKVADFSVVAQVGTDIRKDLGAAFLLESETTPRGDRVTALQAARVGFENELATSSSYSSIADALQRPMLRRTLFQLQKQGKLGSFEDADIEIEVISGVALISNAAQAQSTMSFAQAVASFGPEVMIENIDTSTLVRVLARQSGINEPGLVKSEEQKQAEAQARQDQATQAKAIDTGIESMGEVAVNAAKQQEQ